MVVSAMTQDTGSPLGWRRLEISFAVALAMFMVCCSRLSRTPLRPSIAGRMPILGRLPLNTLFILGSSSYLFLRQAIAAVLWRLDAVALQSRDIGKFVGLFAVGFEAFEHDRHLGVAQGDTAA